jgi:hypothetical protein
MLSLHVIARTDRTLVVLYQGFALLTLQHLLLNALTNTSCQEQAAQGQSPNRRCAFDNPQQLV